MQKAHSYLLIAIALTSPGLAQMAGRSDNSAKPHHIIVPLGSKILSGVVSGDPSKPQVDFNHKEYALAPDGTYPITLLGQTSCVFCHAS